MTLHGTGRLFEIFKAAAEAAPSRLALTFLDAALAPSAYSYALLFDRAEQIAHALRRHQMDTEVPLGILLESQEDQVLHYLAALSAGLVPAILTPPNRKLNREYYLTTMRAVTEYCSFSAVVTDIDDLGPAATLLAPYSLRLKHSSTRQAPARAPGRQSALAGAALLQFSSGTTGIKRGVPLTDEAVIRQLNAYSRAIGLSEGDRIVSWLPLYHDMGFIACLNMPLACGVHCIMMPPLDWVSDPGMYIRAASTYRATLGWNPNFAYAFMAERVRERDSCGADLSSLRGLVNCSEPVTLQSQDRFYERFGRCGLQKDVFWGCYAMAETTFALTHGMSADPGYLDHEGPAGSASHAALLPYVSVGRPIEGVDLIVVDEAGKACGDREPGELWVKSPFRMKGYYNNPDATKKAFHNGWYRTGDLGYRVGQDFFVRGRKKDVLIVGGVNLYPQDLEDTVSQMEGVLAGRVTAFAEFDPRLQTDRIVVLAESTADDADRLTLIVSIRQNILASFQVGNFAVHLVPPGWLIKSSAGKMARSANREKWHRSGGPEVHLSEGARAYGEASPSKPVIDINEPSREA